MLAAIAGMKNYRSRSLVGPYEMFKFRSRKLDIDRKQRRRLFRRLFACLLIKNLVQNPQDAIAHTILRKLRIRIRAYKSFKIGICQASEQIAVEMNPSVILLNVG